MKFKEISPKVATKELLKYRPLRSEIDKFKDNLILLLSKVDEIEREENQKNHVRDFLLNTFYKDSNEINTKNATDLVIHLGKSNKDKVGVIVEAKRPGNKTEMLSILKPNTKALHELVLYYMRERIDENNIDIKHCIATNIYEWFIIDAQYFEKFFARNPAFVKQYEEWRDKKKVVSDTSLFYNDIVKPYIDSLKEEIPVTRFDIRNYEKVLNKNKAADKSLMALYKVQSPYHLLRKSSIDNNALDDKFYKELLHIIGLEELKEKGKTVIRRKEKDRNPGSLIENAIAVLETEGLNNIKDVSQFGIENNEQIFNVALELSLTWINRILFLKLLEGQLITYHKGDQEYRFLNLKTIHDFDELYKLFHQVLARPILERPVTIKDKYKRIPYLNSSLFEISELEEQTIKINALENLATLEILNNSVLKDKLHKNQHLLPLDYIFRFLDAYDFASEGNDEIQEDNRTLINASVLGRVFEKINGYKDGSFFTPGFITMYMCREVIRKAVVQKFNALKNWQCETITDVHNSITDRNEANEIINSLKICDPSVGSGHYLVSALNEIIAIKAELRILQDKEGKRIKEYDIEIINDEIVMTDEYGDPFIYNYNSKESHRIQKTLFHEKQTIIENCLFGVDINPNSVKICRLRLWIELLKNAYYKNESDNTQLETLPNIDINIKCGNSLISRFKPDFDFSKFKDIKIRRTFQNAFKNYKIDIEAYKHCYEKIEKDKIRERIKWFKSAISELYLLDQKEYKEIKEQEAKLGEQSLQFNFGETDINNYTEKNEILSQDISLKRKSFFDKYNSIYSNAIEWRFEFPEILDSEGNYLGFDVLIGNPPYIQLQKMGENANYLQQQGYKAFVRTGDIYCLFYEQGIHLLKPHGFLCFITSNKWMRAAYGEALRSFFLSESNPIQLIDFGGYQIFDAATVDTNILIIVKSQNQNMVQTCIINKDFSLNNMSNYFRQYATVNKNFSAVNSWVILDETEKKIKEKIEKVGMPLRDWDVHINYGIKTGFNDAFIISSERREGLIKKCPKADSIIRPILRGRDIQKYKANWQDLYIIGTFPSLKIDIEKYPAIKDYLLSFGMERLEQTGKQYIVNGKKITSRKLTGNKWFETQDPIGYWKEFESPKIIWKRIGSVIRFCYDETGIACLDSTCFATGKDMKFLTGYLNSSISKKELLNNSPKTGTGDVITSVQALEPIRVPKATESQKKEVAILVDKCIDLLSKDINADISFYEKLIDSIIFSLFNLTNEEQQQIVDFIGVI